MSYGQKSVMVICRSKMPAALKGNYQLTPALTCQPGSFRSVWIATSSYIGVFHLHHA
jgi:hypothetical protein